MSEKTQNSSNLQKILAAGHFAVTGELGPPRSADGGNVKEKAGHLSGFVDAVNITDNQTAIVRMSSMAASAIALSCGLEPIYQLVARDRNRIALQSDLLGAYALGIRNVLALTGDHQRFGDHPQAKNVYDLDSVSLIATIRKLTDEGKLLSGHEMPPEGRPHFFIGAAYNPFADPEEYRVLRAAKKIKAGANFLQSQCIYDLERYARFMKRAVDMGLTEKCYFLAGITPLKSLGMAKYMRDKVPGITIPPEYIKRLEGVPRDKQAEEGIQMALEEIEFLRSLPGVAGVHLMFVEWEHMVPSIATRAHLAPRPEF
ncbi:MAG: methylenetetrahydrofolate reductase [Deltaproteobacteria bacterium]|jgi:methylenetetrahydrofolate reductase (NADPH)|nr:methylenetetrahydrofolate reductase [Deltaproteobacteria bacterium]